MQTWAKRGIQTALVTGGLLMLGTGVASADDDTSPDKPAGPLDLGVAVPVEIGKNAVGVLGHQVDLPEVRQEINTRPVTDAVNKVLAPLDRSGALQHTASPVTGSVNEIVGRAAGHIGQAAGAQPAAERQSAEASEPLAGNQVVGNVAVPIQVTGNAIGLLGNATVESTATQTYAHNADLNTSGAGGGLAGNGVALDWALPVQISGNAVGLAGRGRTFGRATQSASTTGDVTTDGTAGVLAGNLFSPQGATPVQVSGNALGLVGGRGESAFVAESAAHSGGSIETHGAQGAGSGNVGGIPVALPLKVSGNAISTAGQADVPHGASTAHATAGGKRPGREEIPTYIQTNGESGFLSGTITQVEPAVPGTLAANAASVLGKSTVAPEHHLGSSAVSGGYSSTTGENGVLSGTIGDLPTAVPVEVFCAGGALAGHAHANGCENTVTATAGDATYTSGNGGFLSGNSVSPQPAGTAEVFGVGGSILGNASGSAHEVKTVSAGGYNGSQGNDSFGSGTVVQAPVALPAEVLGAGGAVLGRGHGTGSETKTVTSGGGGNTQDDDGVVSANLVQAPLSVPVQAFGVAGALAGQSTGTASTDTTSQAGGSGNANGKQGLAAGNIGALPLSLPVQLHGVGASGLGSAFGRGQGATESLAGGPLTATGEGGVLAGNIVEGPGAAVTQVFGTGAAVVGLAGGDAWNDVLSEAGGPAATNGDGGAFAGNVVAAQVTPVVQAFGDAVSVLGVAHGAAVNYAATTSGGNITTSGVEGAFSGDIFDLSLASVSQVFGIAASAGGVAHAVAESNTAANVGGTDTTARSGEVPRWALAGLGERLGDRSLGGALPAEATAQVFNIPRELLAVAAPTAINDATVESADGESRINLPVTVSELPATAVPSLHWRSRSAWR